MMSVILSFGGAARCDEVAGHITALAIDSQSQLISANRMGQLVWAKKTGYRSGLSNIEDLEFSNDRRKLVVAGGDVSESGGIELLSWPDRKLLSRLDPHSDVVWQVAWSPDESQLVSASQDATCCVIDAKSGTVTATYAGHSRAVVAVQFVSDRVVVSGGLDGTLRVWDSSTGKTIRSLRNHTSVIRDLDLRPKTVGLPMLASAGRDRTVRLWQPTIGRMVKFVRLSSAPLSICWSQSGSELYAACDDGAIRLIDPDTMAVSVISPAQANRLWCMELAIDGRSLFVAGERGHVLTLDLMREVQPSSR
jgi:WD40 repeat protein